MTASLFTTGVVSATTIGGRGGRIKGKLIRWINARVVGHEGNRYFCKNAAECVFRDCVVIETHISACVFTCEGCEENLRFEIVSDIP